MEFRASYRQPHILLLLWCLECVFLLKRRTTHKQGSHNPPVIVVIMIIVCRRHLSVVCLSSSWSERVVVRQVVGV